MREKSGEGHRGGLGSSALALYPQCTFFFTSSLGMQEGRGHKEENPTESQSNPTGQHGQAFPGMCLWQQPVGCTSPAQALLKALGTAAEKKPVQNWLSPKKKGEMGMSPRTRGAQPSLIIPPEMLKQPL